MTQVGKITCKRCGHVFQNEMEWSMNTHCDNPGECSCPEVKKSMTKALQTIDKAKADAGYTVIRIESSIPTNRNEGETQMEVPVSPILQISISKPKQRGRK